MEKKLIVPGEVKICATCSYWDGDRQVDDEYNVVVVAEVCSGECLVQEKICEGMNDSRHMDGCAWEPLSADVPDASAAASDDVKPPVAERKVG